MITGPDKYLPQHLEGLYSRPRDQYAICDLNITSGIHTRVVQGRKGNYRQTNYFIMKLSHFTEDYIHYYSNGTPAATYLGFLHAKQAKWRHLRRKE